MFTTRPELLGTFGVVTSTHWLGSAVGMAVLEKGGNAFDAAAATAFTLQVAEPHLNGPLGDLPVLLYSRREGRPRVLCAQGPAPAAATIDAYRGLGLDLVPGSGLLAAVVPGVFGGWLRLLEDYGTLPLGDVLGPAIAYARDGFPVVPRMTATIETVAGLFRQEWTSSAAVWLPGGTVPRPGQIFANKALAATWSRTLAEAEAGGGSREARIARARDIWYRGRVAEIVARFAQETEALDATGRRHRGLLSADDLAAWEPSYEDPLTYEYGRYTVCKCGPWSQGPVLLQQLALLDGLDIAAMDPVGAAFVHTVVEAGKLAYADREAWYGDPDFVDVPVETLLGRDYNDRRRRLIGAEASPDLIPGTIGGVRPDLSHALRVRTGMEGAAAFGVGEPTAGGPPIAAGDTVHLDVIDRDGNMVSATPSGGWLQSSPAIPELGFCLGNRAQMFWLEPGKATSLAPGKRPRTTLSPTLLLRDGEPYAVLGTPGGDQQDQWSTLMLLHHLDHGMNLQEAIDCPAFHSEHFPSSFWPRARIPRRVVMESRFAGAVAAELGRRGHDVVLGEPWSEGRLTAAAQAGGLLKAAANPRGMQGYAAGR